MDIALAFDANYARHAGAAIASVLAAHPDSKPTFWLVATADVSMIWRQQIVTFVGDLANVEFIQSTDNGLSLPRPMNPEHAYISDAMYIRLALPRLLPAELSRVLYMDCDTLCVGSLEDLFKTNLDGVLFGAVRDAFTRRLIDGSGGLPGLRSQANLDPQAPYLNSGVLLLSLEACRDFALEALCHEYLVEHATGLRFPDQDALNYAAYGMWQRLPSLYNHMMSWRLEPDWSASLADRARIVHFAGRKKPWQSQFRDGPCKELYQKYVSQVAIQHPVRG